MILLNIDFNYLYGYIIEKSSQYGNLNILKYIIEKGRKIWEINRQKLDNYALDIACKYGHLHIVKHLIEEISVSIYFLEIMPWYYYNDGFIYDYLAKKFGNQDIIDYLRSIMNQQS